MHTYIHVHTYILGLLRIFAPFEYSLVILVFECQHPDIRLMFTHAYKLKM